MVKFILLEWYFSTISAFSQIIFYIIFEKKAGRTGGDPATPDLPRIPFAARVAANGIRGKPCCGNFRCKGAAGPPLPFVHHLFKLDKR